MNVSVKLSNGNIINPSFDPAYQTEVLGFYAKAYWNREILGYRVEFNDGESFDVGSYLAEKVGA
jgi:hypothetical protein